MEKAPDYRSYLMRICPREVEGQHACTVMLESVTTGRRVTFPDLGSLVTFLMSTLENDPEVRAGEPATAAGRS
jgi:hypothetical protein